MIKKNVLKSNKLQYNNIGNFLFNFDYVHELR